MVKYQLTTKQRDILSAASYGLRNGSVKSPWILVLNRGDLHGVKGFPNAVELGVSERDFRVLLKYGFLEARSGIGQNRTFDVMEQRIHDAVSSDFEDPSSVSQDMPPTVIVEQGAGSYLNLTVSSQHVTQTINASTSLPDEVKVKLDREAGILYEKIGETQKSHPQESRALEKHLRRLVEDSSEPEPDKQDVTDSLSRLERAAQAFGSIAGIVGAIQRIGEIIATLPFMQ